MGQGLELKEGLEFPHRSQQLNTIKKVGAASNKLGLQGSVFLTGGYVLEATGAEEPREHKDVDVVMSGSATAQKLAAELHQNGDYGEYAAIEGTSLMTLRPNDTQQLSEIDFWWVTETTINGVPCYVYTLDPHFQAFLGKPFGFPKSALSSETIKVGEQQLPFIRPELLALSFGQAAKENVGIDNGALDPKVTQLIQQDVRAADILVHIDPQVVEAYTKYSNHQSPSLSY
jgi:hypothetical protein